MRMAAVILLLGGMTWGQSKIDQVRTTYLNTQVVVSDVAFKTAINEAGRYRAETDFAFIPGKYIGTKATVIAIQDNQDFAKPAATKVNALGEVIDEKNAPEPWFDVVVKFDDGTIAILRDTAPGLTTALLLPDKVAALEAVKNARELKVKGLVGRSLYATALSFVYREDVALHEMQDRNRINPPLLEPLQIVAAKWSDEAGCAIVKLVFGKREALALVNEEGESCDDSQLLASFPAHFTQLDVAAVKGRAITRGMRRLALYYAIGYPEKENDWGRGGKQLIYKSNLIVYLDTNDKVEDVQRFHD